MSRFEEMLAATKADIEATRERLAKLERRAKVLDGLAKADDVREVLDEMLAAPRKGSGRPPSRNRCSRIVGRWTDLAGTR